MLQGLKLKLFRGDTFRHQKPKFVIFSGTIKLMLQHLSLGACGNYFGSET